MTLLRQCITAGCLLLLSSSSLLLEQQQKTNRATAVHGLSSVAVVHNDHRRTNTPLSPPNVVVYYDASQTSHRDLYYHPEQPARITKCLAAIRGSAALWLPPTTTTTTRTTTEGDGAVTRRIRLVDCAPDNGDVDDPQHDDCLSSSSSLSPSSPSSPQEPGEQRQPITTAELEYAEYLLRQIHTPDLVQNLKEKSRQAQAQRLADGKESTLGHVSAVEKKSLLSFVVVVVIIDTLTLYWRNSPVPPTKQNKTHTRLPIHSFLFLDGLH
jgi:hypothetical protein